MLKKVCPTGRTYLCLNISRERESITPLGNLFHCHTALTKDLSAYPNTTLGKRDDGLMHLSHNARNEDISCSIFSNASLDWFALILYHLSWIPVQLEECVSSGAETYPFCNSFHFLHLTRIFSPNPTPPTSLFFPALVVFCSVSLLQTIAWWSWEKEMKSREGTPYLCLAWLPCSILLSHSVPKQYGRRRKQVNQRGGGIAGVVIILKATTLKPSTTLSSCSPLRAMRSGMATSSTSVNEEEEVVGSSTTTTHSGRTHTHTERQRQRP